MRHAQSRLIHSQSELSKRGDKLKDRASSTHNLLNQNSDSNTSPSQPEPKLTTTANTVTSINCVTSKVPLINANVFVPHNKRKSKDLYVIPPNSSARGLFQCPQDSNKDINNDINAKDGKSKGNTNRSHNPMSLASNTATEDRDRNFDLSGH